MGQYKQWLHYREIDQLLRSQLAVSHHELAQLQTQVEVLGKHTSSLENEIFRALLKPELAPDSQEEHPVQLDEPITAEEWEEELVIEEVEEEDLATISPALLAWGRLPNFDIQMIQEPERTRSGRTPEPLPSQNDEQLLPSDISAFIHERYLTNPEITVPWWLQDLVSSHNGESQEPQPIDRQSERADQLVQRWFERWEQQPTKTERSQEDQTHESGN